MQDVAVVHAHTRAHHAQLSSALPQIDRLLCLVETDESLIRCRLRLFTEVRQDIFLEGVGL